jgi:hypothetical protein
MRLGDTCRKGHQILWPKDLTKNAHCRQCSRVPVDPTEGVECLLCGDILRSLATNHLQMLHGITPAEYQKQFPGAPLHGSIYLAIRRDLWDDRAEENPVPRPERQKGARQKMCAKGLHELKGKNVCWVGEGSRRRRSCRACKNESVRRWNAANAERKREYMREYWKKNREERLSYKAAQDPEKVRAQARARHKKNPERRRAHNRAHYAKNREKLVEYQRQYRARKRAEAAA